MQVFPTKLPEELIVLTFNFAPDLGNLTLTGTPEITITVFAGADPDPNAILNGPAQLDSTQTQWLVPVKGGVAETWYAFEMVAGTTSPSTVLEIQAVLPVGYP